MTPDIHSRFTPGSESWELFREEMRADFAAEQRWENDHPLERDEYDPLYDSDEEDA